MYLVCGKGEGMQIIRDDIRYGPDDRPSGRRSAWRTDRICRPPRADPSDRYDTAPAILKVGETSVNRVTWRLP